MKIDIVLGIMLGDEGKGKITSHLLEESLRNHYKGFRGGSPYTHCLKSSGGHNSGHSSYINNQKYVTHVLPTGVLWGVESIIGQNCVLNVRKFFQEVEGLESQGFNNIRQLIKIANNTHIITDAHLIEDGQDTRIGTTRTGNGPAYRNKHARIGIRARDVEELQPFLADVYEEFYGIQSQQDAKVLVEGSQGFFLDINSDEYPYVTSSHCDIGGVLSNGLCWKDVREVYGVIKGYCTYVGAKDFQPSGEIYEKLQQVGKEFGATTGRVRKTNWNRLSLLRKAILVNGITTLIVNKMDVLKELNTWAFYDLNEKLITFDTEVEFKKSLTFFVNCLGVRKVTFSYSPHSI